MIEISSNINSIGAIDLIRIKDHKQGYLLDPWDYVGPKRRRRMEESWAGFFRREILCKLPADKLASAFTSDFGRPTKELHTILGVLFLQQMKDLTDEETVDQVAFNLQWHYALNIPEESDEAKYISLKTLWSMRKVVTDLRLDEAMFTHLTEVMAKLFKVDMNKQRLDSVHIMSNMRHLGRIGIFTRSNHKFLINLKRQCPECFAELEKEHGELVGRYLTEKALGCFSMIKPAESDKTLSMVSQDLYLLVERFHGQEDVTSLHSYQLLCRVLNEQCTICDEESLGAIAIPTASKEVSSASLQNPSDPDAAYDSHKGQGYQVQVMETYCDSQDEAVKEKALNLITHVQLEKASAHDSHALLVALEDTNQRCCAPRQLLADSLYGSDDNTQKAKDLGIEIISPVMKGSETKDRLHLHDFQFSQSGQITACPAGQAPLKIIKHKEKRYSIAFSSEQCRACPRQGICPVKPGSKHHYLRCSEKAMRLAPRRIMEQTPEFRDKYRFRAGIEATFSGMDRRTGIKHLRVRGFSAVRFCAFMKALAINLLRATRVCKTLWGHCSSPRELFAPLYRLFSVIKELYTTKLQNIYATGRIFHDPTFKQAV
jgi:hypothetical protein